MKYLYCIFILVLLTSPATAQDPLTDSLKRNLSNAKTPREKIKNLSELSGFYIALNPRLSEEYAKQMNAIAEESRDRKLMVLAMLFEADRYYLLPGVQGNIEKAINLSQQALELARTNSLEEETAWSYMYLARGHRGSGKKEQALNYNNQALSIAAGLDSDSLKISCYNSIGNTYLANNEKLLAFRNFLYALDVAERFKNFEQLKKCYANLSDFYAGLNDYEKAKDYRYKIEQLAVKHNRVYDRLECYYYLGRICVANKQYDRAQAFYDRAIALSDTLKFTIFKLNVYGAIVDLYFFSNQMQKAVETFQSQKELQAFMVNAGFDYFLDLAYGNLYTAVGKYDSAQYYYTKAEPAVEAKAAAMNKFIFYFSYSNYLKKTNDFNKAELYLMKGKAIAEQLGSLDWMMQVSKNLDTIFMKKGDYASAYQYAGQYHMYKDSLKKLTQEKDLMILEVDNENKRKERLAKIAEEEKRNRHNLQYMGITIVIAAVFILLVMAGIFSVSKGMIKVLGFFAFIFLFEFIILLADNQIHHVTHGEPWKVFAIKIGLIAMLLPLHHWLEEKVIHYLTTHKLLRGRVKMLQRAT